MQKVIISFLIAFILLMVVIILSRTTQNNTQAFGRLADTSRYIIQHYNKVDVDLRSGIIFSPRYDSSAASELYVLYKGSLNRLEPNLKQLKFRVKGNPQQTAIVDSLEAITRVLIPVLRTKDIVEVISKDDPKQLEEIKQAHLLVQRGLQLEEETLLKNKEALRKANNEYNTLTLVLAILAIVIITATFFQQFFLSKKSIWLEGFLESILNTTQNGIIYLKAIREKGKITDFRVEYANKTVTSLAGITPEAVIGKLLKEVEAPIGKADLFAAYCKVVETGAATQFEHLYQYGDIERWLYLSAAKRDDGVTVAFHNISDLKRYEADLQTNIAALEQTNQELEEYAYAASHDLQEPLRKIRTFGSFLQDTQGNKLDENGRHQLEKIMQSTERMSLLIKDLLSFSSLKEKEEFEPTDLHEIFENVLNDLEMIIAQKKAIITHDKLPEIDAIPVQMNQLFYNLVNNALKFANDELPLHLDVSCKVVRADDVKDVPGLEGATTYYEIVFSDNGIGFSQEFATQIFGMFKRLNDKNRYAGSGIGLSLCKKVVANHGGVIMANGKEGVGAQFYIYLPGRQRPTKVAVPEME